MNQFIQLKLLNLYLEKLFKILKLIFYARLFLIFKFIIFVFITENLPANFGVIIGTKSALYTVRYTRILWQNLFHSANQVL